MELNAGGDPKTGAASFQGGIIKGDDQVNARAGVFATTNSSKGPVTKGLYGALNANGHSLSVEHGHTPGFGSSTTVAGQANLMQTKQAGVNATAFHTHNNRSFDQFGGGVNMQHAAGHSAALGVKHVPQFNMTTAHATATANLHTSPSGNFRVDATANANRHLSGPFRGKSDFGGGANIQMRF